MTKSKKKFEKEKNPTGHEQKTRKLAATDKDNMAEAEVMRRKNEKEKKEKEDKVIELYTPSIIPVNQRIYCQRFTPDEKARTMKKDSGIVIVNPATFRKKTSEKEDEEIHLYRYFVCAASADCPVIEDADGKKFKLKKGMEIYKFIPESAIEVDDVMVKDWGLGGMEFVSIHFTEISGVARNIPETAD